MIRGKNKTITQRIFAGETTLEILKAEVLQIFKNDSLYFYSLGYDEEKIKKAKMSILLVLKYEYQKTHKRGKNEKL